jgi:serine/threonine protein kinase
MNTELTNRLLLTRYRVGTAIASGSVGSVFSGTDTRTGADVVVKFFDSNDDNFSNWIDECRSAMRLRHANVIAAINLGFDEGSGFHVLILQRGYGGSLRRALVNNGTFSKQEIRRLLVDIASGLNHAHSEGLVHRDIKPENLIALHGTGEPPWAVTDFGCSRFLARGSRATSVVGSAMYVAPEVLDHNADAACDQYSLGITGLEMVESGTLSNTASKTVTTAVRNNFLYRTPTDNVDRVVATLLQPDQGRRFPCMASVIEVLSGQSQNYSIISLHDSRVAMLCDETITIATSDRCKIDRRLRIPRSRRFVNSRGVTRPLIATDRRVLALTSTTATETLFVVDHGLSVFAASEAHRMVASCDNGTLTLWRMNTSEQLAEVTLPTPLRDLDVIGGFVAGGLIFGGPKTNSIWQLTISGQLSTCHQGVAPLVEVAESNGELSALVGDSTVACAIDFWSTRTAIRTWQVAVAQIGWRQTQSSQSQAETFVGSYVGLPNPMDAHGGPVK